MFERPKTHPTLARFVGQAPEGSPDDGAKTAAAAEPGRMPRTPAPGSTPTSGVSGASAAPPSGSTSPLQGDWTPKVELPKGGGAIGGIGQKLEANAFTGSGSLSIPIPTPPARGLAPQLSLAYASGAGNGPFGLGWSLGVPSVARKTDKGLPEYRDAVESDTFVLAGAEDLVPLRNGGGERIVRESSESPSPLYDVYPYRPRVEGLFARIERWVAKADGQTHWRVITKDDVTSWYGRTAQARVANPEDERLVYEWRLEETRDDKGNIVQYTYKAEDAVLAQSGLVAENNRAPSGGSYLKQIRYGNAAPGVAAEWLFEVVLDYGEHGSIDGGTGEVVVTPAEDQSWALRDDAFSWFRAGFDVRMRRRCTRVLVFHDISELGSEPVLVRSVDFTYDEAQHLSKLVSVTARMYVPGTVAHGYVAADMPALSMTYTSADLVPVVREIDRRSAENLPDGVDGSGFRFVDLEGEGLPGIVAEIGGTLHYKRSRGDGRFGVLERLEHQVTTAKLGGGAELRDVDGDGRLELAEAGGFYMRRASGDWADFVAFEQVPSIDLGDPNLQRIDLDGDGRADLLVARDDGFWWYPSEGTKGFGAPRFVPKPLDERDGPALVFADGTRSIFLADMTGDGLSDLVRVGNGAVYYWPNLGHGRFGRRVTMAGSPVFAAADLFDPAFVRLADLDGSGTTDLVYLDGRGARAWRNLSGNGFSEAVRLRGFPGVDSVTAVEVIDLYGKGTACLMWSTAADWAAPTKVLALELLPHKPHLLASVIDGMGAETRLAWEPSTVQYLRDRAAGRPWITRLPFPVHVVTRVEQYDAVARRRFVQRYAYHHGYYDGIERELRGFAMVERWDTEGYDDFDHEGLFDLELYDTVEENLHQPPVYTKTWFHTGAYLGRERISRLLANEYWAGDAGEESWRLADTVLPSGMTAAEGAEACRALRGRTLRQEVYALDGSELEALPYSVTESNFTVRRLQAAVEGDHAVFFAHERESIALHYERMTENPRVAHAMVLQVGDYGDVERSVAIAYPSAEDEGVGSIVVNEADFCTVDDVATLPDVYRASVPTEQRAFELHVTVDEQVPLAFEDVVEAISSATTIQPETTPTEGDLRRLRRARSFFYADDLSGALAHGQCGTRALPHHTETAAFSEGQRAAVFGTDVSSTLLTSATDGGYASADDLYWVVSGRQVFDEESFYLPVAGIDPFGNEATIAWDAHALFVTSLTDALGNVITVEYDYRVLAARQLTDANDNRTAVAFDTRGVVVATAQMGKAGASEGDTLEDPTSVFSYDVFAWADDGEPNWVRTQARDTHGNPGTAWIERISYFDGSGNTILDKVSADPGLAAERDVNGELVLVGGLPNLVTADPRWVGSGRTVFDNKGNAIKQHEPYFSSTDAFEDEVELREQGVTVVLRYDPLGRLVRTDFPDGTYARVTFTPWQQTSWDRNDTAGETTWHSERMALSAGDPERRAAEVTAPHHDTPTVTHLDPLGRPVRVVAVDGFAQTVTTRSVLDIEGNVLEVIDGRDNTAEARTYGMLGQALRVTSEDAGERRMVSDVLGQPLRLFDDRGRTFRFEHDALRRATHAWVQPAVGSEQLLVRNAYGELAASPEASNLRGRLLRQYDGAGVVEHVAFDLAGNELQTTRMLHVTATATPDWVALATETTLAGLDAAAASLLDTETFTTTATYDALGRPVTQTTHDGSISRYAYNEAGLLESVAVDIRGASPPTSIVSDIEYDVHGRRLSVAHGNGTTTAYTYDPLTFRLTRIRTTRNTGGDVVQDLRYVYDPVGNVVEIQDDATQTEYFANAVVEPHQQFTYDALYRLVSATGREHVSQGQPTSSELTPGSQPETSDPAAMRRYTETYAYDAVGNLLEVQHVATGGSWTRGYHYATDGNRLLASSLPGDSVGVPASYSATYAHDAHGNMTAMPHLAAIDWDALDRMQHADLGGGGDVYFQYDAAGNRVRKIRVNTAGTQTEERIYLGTLELYRERTSGALQLERETLHVADDTARVCMVETRTVSGGSPVSSPANDARYQYGNHLGTVSLELDQAANTISYEEHHPYGTSAYRAVDSSITVSAKRYRYTGMERDEETGLDHMGLRYYASWLGRWTAADPIGLGDGVSRFAYVSGNPVDLRDPSGARGAPARLTAEQQAEVNRLVQQDIDAAGSGGLDRDVQLEMWNRRKTQVLGEAPRTQKRKLDVRSTERTAAEGIKAHDDREAKLQAEKAEAFAVVTEAVKKSAEKLLDGVQSSLDAVGLIEGLGTPADLLNGTISLLRGDLEGAALSGGSALPFVGAVFGGVKIVGKHGDEVVDAADAVLDAADAARDAERAVDAADTAADATRTADAAKGGGQTVEDFLPEAQRRLEAVKKEFPGTDAVVGMARKADIKQIDRIVKDLKLNKEQRQLLHREITGQDLSLEEIKAIADDIAKFTPKGGRTP